MRDRLASWLHPIRPIIAALQPSPTPSMRRVAGRTWRGCSAGGGLAGLVVLGAGDLAAYVFSRAPAVLLPIFGVAVLITGCLIGLAYSNLDAQARTVQRLLDAGTWPQRPVRNACAGPAPSAGRRWWRCSSPR